MPDFNSQLDVPTIQILYFAPSEPPVVCKVPNTLDAMQELVGGLISPFSTGIEGTVGVANDEAIVDSIDFNRSIPVTEAQIFGPFFVAGDAPDFRSLTPLELENALDALAPELSQNAFREIMLTHDSGKALAHIAKSLHGGHLEPRSPSLLNVHTCHLAFPCPSTTRQERRGRGLAQSCTAVLLCPKDASN